MSRVLPYLWYPLLFAGAIAAFAAMLAAGMTLVLATYLPILAAALVIVVLELRFPERLEWRPQGSDVAADAAFMAFVQILLARTLAVLVVFAIAEWMHWWCLRSRSGCTSTLRTPGGRTTGRSGW